MKRYAKEAFFKSFFLFFTTLLLLNGVIFWLYYTEQKRNLHSTIFNKLKIYNYNFKDKDIGLDIVPIKDAKELYILHVTENEIFAYFDIPKSKTNSLKLIYPYARYERDILNIKKRVFMYGIFSSVVLLFLSIIYSVYSLKPLREALELLEEFLKDIIHDLNTPISSILLNLGILKKGDSKAALKRIEFSARYIGTLYNNLETMIKEKPLDIKEVDISKLIKEKAEFYSYLYPHIEFETDIKVEKIETSFDEFSRILDNLISNACKYNKRDGYVKIEIDKERMIVEDRGIGIKNPKKVFERFYKENERGLGLGLSIVKKLVEKLGYEITIDSEIDRGTRITVTFK